MSTINIIGLVVSIIVGALIVFFCMRSFVRAHLQSSLPPNSAVEPRNVLMGPAMCYYYK